MDKNLLALVSDGFRELRSKAVHHLNLRDALVSVESVWNPALDRLVRDMCVRADAPTARATKRPPPWFIGMTSRFRQAIGKMDPKFQGRILHALGDIADSPMKLNRETVQPLTGALQGCWSYDLGGAQLIYFADQSSGDITLLAFAAVSSPSRPSRTVLLLEDVDEFRQALCDHLVARSYQPTSVRNGADGVRAIMRDPFDIIICDMMMPKMNGEMFYQAVKRVRPAAGQRFIFFSGHKGNPTIEDFFRRVNAPVLYKPFNLVDLDLAMEDVFRRLG